MNLFEHIFPRSIGEVNALKAYLDFKAAMEELMNLGGEAEEQLNKLNSDILNMGDMPAKEGSIMSRPLKFRAWHKTKKAFMYFELSELNDSMITKVEDGWYLDDCELMQFTGLLDEQGKEIFEGDVVATPLQWFDIEQQPEKKNRLVKNMGINLFYSGDWSIEPDEVEVIGNIWEHPELLKGT